MQDLAKKLIRVSDKAMALLGYINKNEKIKPNDIDWFSSIYLELLLYVRKIGQDINGIRADHKRDKIAWLDVLDKELVKEKNNETIPPQGK